MRNEALSAAWVAEESRRALDRIRSLASQTPVVPASWIDSPGSYSYLKLENHQKTGSFKLRGALNRLMTLTDDQRRRGCVTASSGNHGAAVAWAQKNLGIDGTIFVPENTSSSKIDKIKQYGGNVRTFGTDGLDTEQHARAYAKEHGQFYVSPYNDPQVIAGQGTIGIELLAELPNLQRIFIAVGGGGLISGIASVLRSVNPSIEIIGCQPAESAVMAASMAAGHVVEMESNATLSDGTAGGIEQDSVTFGLCQQLIDEMIIVDESEIADAMRDYERHEGERVEGAAGVAVAAARRHTSEVAGDSVVVICGGNVSDATWASVASPADDSVPTKMEP